MIAFDSSRNETKVFNGSEWVPMKIRPTDEYVLQESDGDSFRYIEEKFREVYDDKPIFPAPPTLEDFVWNISDTFDFGIPDLIRQYQNDKRESLWRHIDIPFLRPFFGTERFHILSGVINQPYTNRGPWSTLIDIKAQSDGVVIVSFVDHVAISTVNQTKKLCVSYDTNTGEIEYRNVGPTTGYWSILHNRHYDYARENQMFSGGMISWLAPEYAAITTRIPIINGLGMWANGEYAIVALGNARKGEYLTYKSTWSDVENLGFALFDVRDVAAGVPVNISGKAEGIIGRDSLDFTQPFPLGRLEQLALLDVIKVNDRRKETEQF